jgi:hypothetical protein
MSGSSGLSGFDSSALKNVLLMHGQASQRLHIVKAQFSQWLSNGSPPFAAFQAALANRLIAMNIFPGVRPTGIGGVWRRLVAKCVLTGAGHSAPTSCGSDQLCAGLRAGTDGTIHGVSTLYNELEDSDSESGFPLIDANNAFNEINRINRIPVMAPILEPIFGVHLFWGHISLKIRTYCPLFSHDSSPFKGTCFLIRLIVLLDALYGPHLHWCSHRLFHNCPKHVFCQLGTNSGPCKS